jgi:hypothetical protein
VVSDVWIIEVYPITHLVGEVCPLFGVFHHLTAASVVILVNRNFLTDILLSDSESFLNRQFHGETMGVPSGFALHAETLHGFETAENILNGTRHHVVDARHTVSGGGTLEEDEGGAPFASFHTCFKEVAAIP